MDRCEISVGSGENPNVVSQELALSLYAVHSLMLGRPYVGQKTLEVLRVLDRLASAGHTRVHLVGNGWEPSAFAALLDSRSDEATLIGASASYAAIADSENYEWPLSSFIPALSKSATVCCSIGQLSPLRASLTTPSRS